MLRCQGSREFLPRERLDFGAYLFHSMQFALSVSQCTSRVTLSCKTCLPTSPPHEVSWVLSLLCFPACKSSVAIPRVSLALLDIIGEVSLQLETRSWVSMLSPKCHDSGEVSPNQKVSPNQNVAKSELSPNRKGVAKSESVSPNRRSVAKSESVAQSEFCQSPDSCGLLRMGFWQAGTSPQGAAITQDRKPGTPPLT